MNKFSKRENTAIICTAQVTIQKESMQQKKQEKRVLFFAFFLIKDKQELEQSLGLRCCVLGEFLELLLA